MCVKSMPTLFQLFWVLMRNITLSCHRQISRKMNREPLWLGPLAACVACSLASLEQWQKHFSFLFCTILLAIWWDWIPGSWELGESTIHYEYQRSATNDGRLAIALVINSPSLALDLARSNWVRRNGNGKWQGKDGVNSEEEVINIQEKNFLLVASTLNDKSSLPEFL